MHSCFIFIFFACCVAYKPPAFSKQSRFQNEFNHFSGENIEEIANMGSQCSGNVYMLTLAKKNFPNCVITDNKYGYKHCYPWLDLTNFQITKKTDTDSELINSQKNLLKNSKKCLFIYITSNVYDCFKLSYAEQVSGYESFFHWISSPWAAVERTIFNPEKWNPYEDRAFANPLELRKYKILNFLQTGSFISNFMFVRYEDIVQAPEEFINFIAENFQLQTKDSFQEVPLHKLNWIRSLNHKKDFSVSQKDLDFLNLGIDWEVESLLGYKKNEQPQSTN